ncbi:MAG: rod shape-determining protein RodA [Candidatus Sericytochromatia bacterium]|nr:rod shape-determining protein RodA [Candidatus Sericytochromatia bacterium]
MALGMPARHWRQFDPWLLLAVFGIVGVSLACIHSVTHGGHKADFGAQAALFGPALALALLLAVSGYHWLRGAAPFIYGLNIVGLLSVMLFGHTALGAQRWISIAGVKFQPSEFAKLALIVTLSRVLSEKSIHATDGLLTVLGTVLIPALLIFKQPDLGTSLVYGAIAVGMTFWAGLPVSVLFKMASPLLGAVCYHLGPWVFCGYLAALAGWLIWSRKGHKVLPLAVWLANLLAGVGADKVWNLLKEYQKQRILTFLDPEADPLGAGYHVIQSKIAIGSGGWLGKGFMQGTQTQLHFIPEQHTDFIFSVVGEELGFAGGLVLMLLYAVVLGRGLLVAMQAQDRFGALLCIGVVTMLGFHVIVNLGMAMGLLPVVGIPLPMMSFGRTALVTNMLAIGLIEAVAMRRRKLMF